jgi:predicted Kef-type K+ transport protein
VRRDPPGRCAWLLAGRALAALALVTIAASAPIYAGAARAASADGGGGHATELSAVLIALAVVIGAARLVGRAFARLGQPAVLGEILAGILLGPSFLGRLAPGIAARMLPASAIPALEIIAQAGVILYLFLVGLGLEGTDVRARRATVTAVALASLALPFALGLCVAPLLHPQLATETVPFGVFALFVGVSLSVTAFPVLARILEDEGLTTTPLARTIHQTSATTTRLAASAAFRSLRVLDDLSKVASGPLGRETLHLQALATFRSKSGE